MAEEKAGDSRDMMERLNETNRLCMEALLLPRGKILSQEQVDGVRDAIQTYITDRDIKPAQVAREIDYGPAALRQWMAGRYKGNVDKIAHAVNDWMERDRRREGAARPSGYVKMWVAETMRTIAYQADKQGLMAAIVSPAGSGKSLVLKALTEELRGVYVYCDPDLTDRELMYKLAVALGWRKSTATKAVMRDFIIEELADTKRVIFLDEAQQLRRSIRVVRSIYDQAGVPIVMVGTAEILEYIDDRADGRGQFASRCIRFNIIDSLRSAEGPGGGRAGGRDLFTIEEIQQFFASKKIRLAVDGLRIMWLLACQPNHGTLRLIEKLAGIARDLNPSVHAITREHVLEALELFRGIAEASYLQKLADRYDGTGAAETKVA